MIAREGMMGVSRALKKVSWSKLIRYLVVGMAGELVGRSEEKTHLDAMKRLEEQQQETAEALRLITVQLKFVFWTAVAALAVAVIALVVARL